MKQHKTFQITRSQETREENVRDKAGHTEVRFKETQVLETFSQPVTEHLILQFQNHRGQQLFSLRHDMIYSQQLSQQYFPSGTHSAAVTAAGRSSVQCQSKPSLIEDETLLQSVCARR